MNHDACEVVNTPGYYKSGTNYFKVNYQGVADDATKGDNSETAGEFDSVTGKFNIAASSPVNWSSGIYIYNDIGSVLTGSVQDVLVNVDTDSIVPVSDGVYAANTESLEKIDLETTDTDTLTGIKGNVAVFNCNGLKCAKTKAIIKSNESGEASYFTVDTSGGATEITSAHSGVDCSSAGKMDTTGNKLCLTTAKFAQMGATKRYVMTNINGNYFEGTANSGMGIVIKTGTNILARDNLIESKYKSLL